MNSYFPYASGTYTSSTKKFSSTLISEFLLLQIQVSPDTDRCTVGSGKNKQIKQNTCLNEILKKIDILRSFFKTMFHQARANVDLDSSFGAETNSHFM